MQISPFCLFKGNLSMLEYFFAPFPETLADVAFPEQKL